MNITFTKSFLKIKNATKKALIVMAAMGLGNYGAQAQTTNPSPYCTVSHYTGYTACNTYTSTIELFQIGSLKFKTPCPVKRSRVYNYYQGSNFPNYTTNLTMGGNYDVDITTVIAYQYYSTWSAVWIDYNGDGDFSDAGEYLGTTGRVDNNGKSMAAKTMNVKVPCTATQGKTRLRVRTEVSYYTNSANWSSAAACGNYPGGFYGYGETIDFDVNIVNAGNPSANFILPDTIFENSPAFFTNSNQAGYTHEWSVDEGSGFQKVSTATNLNYVFYKAGTYDVRVKSTNCTGSATITKSVTVIAPTVAPTPKFVCSITKWEVKPGTFYNGEADLFMYDLSTGGASDWLWSFYSQYDPDDETKGWFINSEYDQNPLLLIFDTTLLSVCMEVSNSIGTNKLCKLDYIDINYPAASAAGNKFENWSCRETSCSLDSGVLYDTKGPSNETATNQYCTFLIGGCEVKDITLTLAELQLGYYDYLTIYDGTNAKGEIIGSYRYGSTPPAETLKALSGNVYVEYVTGQYSYNYSGFKLIWKSNYVVDGGPRANFTIPKAGGTDTVFACSVGNGNDIIFNNTSDRSQKFISYEWIFDYSPNVAYPVGFSNSKAANPTYTYTTTNKTYNVRLVVESCEGRDTIIKSFVLATTTKLPTVDFTTDDNILFPNGEATISNKTIAGCGGKWIIAPATDWTITSGSLTSDIIKVKFAKKGRYTITREETNDNGKKSLTKSEFIEVIDYCVPSAPYNSTEAGIAFVSFAGINNASGSGIQSFEDYTGIATYDIVMGTTYQFKTSRTGNTDPVDRVVWLDYDRNGTFTANEIVASESNSYNKDFTANIKIKGINDVTAGNMRMRVACAISGYTMSACGPLKVGEFEDYLVNLKGDDVPPTITMLGNNPVILEVGNAYNDAGATAFDNLEGDITYKMNTDNQVDISQAGIYYVTYTVKDNSNNEAGFVRRTVIVKADITNPVITINGGNTIVHEVHTPFVAPTASVTDNPGNTSIGYIIASNNLNIDKLGTYQVVFEATDAYGNSSQEVLTVEVKDQTAPMFHLNGNDPYQVQLGMDFIDPTTVSDNYYSANDITVVITGATTINANSPGNYIRNYTATDASGNVTTLSRTFIVSDFVAPTINTTAGTEYMIVEVNSKFNEPEVKAFDNFGAAKLTKSGSFDINELGIYVITYTATDAYGNTTVYNRTIEVVDTEKPIITDKVITIAQWSNFDANDFSNINVTDNYNAPSDFQNATNNCKMIAVSNDVTTQDPGIYFACYVAIDESNNQSDMKCLAVKVTGNTSGIENNFANSINVYPNPSNGQFSVNFTNTVTNNVKVKITNLLGEVIATYNYNDLVGNKLSVNLDGVAAGVYFVNVEDNNAVGTKKITITK